MIRLHAARDIAETCITAEAANAIKATMQGYMQHNSWLFSLVAQLPVRLYSAGLCKRVCRAQFWLLVSYLLTMGLLALWAALLLSSNAIAAKWIGETRTEDGINYQCKCYSDNACWPSNKEWDAFNRTLDGALQLAIPAAVSCHYKFENYTFNTYDAAKCADVTEKIGNGIYGNEQWM